MGRTGNLALAVEAINENAGHSSFLFDYTTKHLTGSIYKYLRRVDKTEQTLSHTGCRGRHIGLVTSAAEIQSSFAFEF